MQTFHRHGLALVAVRSQNVVISLLSALSYHGLTSHLPSEIRCTVGPRDRAPHLDWPRTRVTRMSGAALTSGVEKFVSQGSGVRIPLGAL